VNEQIAFFVGIAPRSSDRQRGAGFAGAGPNRLLDAAAWMITAASSGSRNPRPKRSCAATRTRFHVIITAAIALLDRRAGVARAFPLRFRSGECGEGGSGDGVRKSPDRLSGERRDGFTHIGPARSILSNTLNICRSNSRDAETDRTHVLHPQVPVWDLGRGSSRLAIFKSPIQMPLEPAGGEPPALETSG
jgi:hypothetical protein